MEGDGGMVRDGAIWSEMQRDGEGEGGRRREMRETEEMKGELEMCLSSPRHQVLRLDVPMRIAMAMEVLERENGLREDRLR